MSSLIYCIVGAVAVVADKFIEKALPKHWHPALRFIVALILILAITAAVSLTLKFTIFKD